MLRIMWGFVNIVVLTIFVSLLVWSQYLEGDMKDEGHIDVVRLLLTQGEDWCPYFTLYQCSLIVLHHNSIEIEFCVCPCHWHQSTRSDTKNVTISIWPSDEEAESNGLVFVIAILYFYFEGDMKDEGLIDVVGLLLTQGEDWSQYFTLC